MVENHLVTGVRLFSFITVGGSFRNPAFEKPVEVGR